MSAPIAVDVDEFALNVSAPKAVEVS